MTLHPLHPPHPSPPYPLHPLHPPPWTARVTESRLPPPFSIQSKSRRHDCPGLVFTRCDRQDFIPCPTFHAHSCSVLRPWNWPFHTATFAQFRRPSSLNPRPCLRATRGRTKIRAAHEHLGREKGRGSRGGKGRSTPRARSRAEHGLEAETLY